MAENGGSAGGAGAVFIKRVKKVEGGAHGGAWKIAYADFVTAMMAFFLLLWLLNSVTQEQLEGISNYFAPASIAPTTSGAGGVLGGQTISAEGSEVSARAKPTVSLELPPPKTGLGGEESSETQKPEEAAEEAKKEAAQEVEQEQFKKAESELKQALQEIPGAEELQKSLMVDNTPEGLRIQIVDQEGLAMFSSGGSEPLGRARRMLEMVKHVVEKMLQKIAISGHTDGTKFGSGSEYTNWELSVDRANAARRVLRDFGLPIDRLSRVVGKADTEPLLKADPNNARNRRLSIVLLRGTAPKAEVEPGGEPAVGPGGEPAAEPPGEPAGEPK